MGFTEVHAALRAELRALHKARMSAGHGAMHADLQALHDHPDTHEHVRAAIAPILAKHGPKVKAPKVPKTPKSTPASAKQPRAPRTRYQLRAPDSPHAGTRWSSKRKWHADVGSKGSYVDTHTARYPGGSVVVSMVHHPHNGHENGVWKRHVTFRTHDGLHYPMNHGTLGSDGEAFAHAHEYASRHLASGQAITGQPPDTIHPIH